ncbi:MAG: ClpXP protease specificity-enhancing factor SspB [Henriciella sp.]|jgi:hypothetical protein
MTYRSIFAAIFLISSCSNATDGGICSIPKTNELRKQNQIPISYERLAEQHPGREILPVLTQRIEDWGCMPQGHSFLYGVETDYPGVSIPSYLKERHQNEIWIILEFEFEQVSDGKFGMALTLQFDGKAETLIIPYESIFRFVDENANFDISF